MRDPIPWLSRFILSLVLAMAVGAAPVFAQGGSTSTISGTVSDTSGAVVPGADIVVKSNTTGTTYNAVSGSDGSFTIPAVPPGSYTITVTLMGFKTAVLNDVTANVAQIAEVKAVLTLGALEETVVVSGATEIIQTQATSVAATLGTKQIASLPVVGRGAFELVGYMPGVATTTGSLRDGTVNGLPQSAVNITLDGMNIQDNYAKSWDGMFTRVSPRLDAVEEVTVSTAAQGADMGSQGAAQVRFVTRSGTNRFQGSAYFYYRRDWMNTNTWFNLNRNVDAVTGKPTARPRLFQDQPGFRVGGPIWKDKAFFFVNYEWISSPGTNTANRTIMSPLSEQGKFQYAGGTVDLMALAAKNGHTSTIDPVVAKLLADVRSTTGKGTVTTTIDPLTQTFAWAQPTESTTTYPTVRLDYNITSNHRLTGSGTYNHLVSDPDTGNGMQRIFPDFPVHGKQDSERYSWQLSMRSTLTSTMVNEVRYGATGGATLFYPDLAVDMYNNSAFGDMKGYALSWSNFKSISNPWPGSTPSSREGSTMVIEDTLNWLKGKHALTFGGSATRGDVWLKNQRLVPTVTLGFATGDPADTMFNTANFPGASSTDITNARNLYMVLAGRVQSITRDARVGEDGEQYNILGQSLQKGRMWQVGGFVQDSWRWKPTFTVNAGVRYEVQLPFRALNNSYSYADIDDVFGVTGPGDLTVGSVVTGLGNLYKPGVFQGSPTQYTMLESGTTAFATDWNNVAPSIGAAWTTGAESGFMRTILGAPGDSVIRGGYNISYQRGGMSDMTEVFGDNPGILIDATRSTTNGNLGTLAGAVRGRRRQPGRARHSADAHVPDGRAIAQFERAGLRPEHHAAVRRNRHDRDPAQALAEHLARGALHPHRQLRQLDPAEPLRRPQLQRDQHRREQVHRRVQGGAGQPRGEHRRRQGIDLRVHGRRRHEPAADLPRQPERIERLDRLVQVHGVRVDQYHPGPVDVRAQPEPADGREQPADQRDLPRELGRGGPALQLLRGEPGGEQLDCRHQRGQHEVQRDPVHLQPPVRRRLPGAVQLHVQQGLPERLLRVPQAVGGAGAELHERRRPASATSGTTWR